MMRRFLALVLALGLLAPWPALAWPTPDAFVVFPTASITADTASGDIVNKGYPSAYCRLVVANLGASQTVSLQFQGKWADGTYQVLASTTAVNVNGTTVYAIGTSLATNAGVTAVNASFAFPRVWRVNVDVTNANNADVTVDCMPMNTSAG
jgi:hypothetical protein